MSKRNEPFRPFSTSGPEALREGQKFAFTNKSSDNSYLKMATLVLKMQKILPCHSDC